VERLNLFCVSDNYSYIQREKILVNIRIVLADDHPFVLLGVRSMLETRAGVAIVGQAGSPTTLIELLRRTPCDVLVTDLSMPDPAGLIEDELHLIRHIQAEWPGLRIIVMSTTTNPALLHALAADGAVSLLSKTRTVARDRRTCKRRAIYRKFDCETSRKTGDGLRSEDGASAVGNADDGRQDVRRRPLNCGNCRCSRMSSPHCYSAKA